VEHYFRAVTLQLRAMCMQIHDNLGVWSSLPQKYSHLSTEMLIQNLSHTIFATYTIIFLCDTTNSYGILISLRCKENIGESIRIQKFISKFKRGIKGTCQI
jgi:hypothetical protein